MRIAFLTVIILCLILSIRYILYFQNLKTYGVGDVFRDERTLLADPKQSESHQTFRVGTLVIELPLYPEYFYGDRLSIEGVVADGSFETEEGKTITRLVVKNPTIQILPAHPLIQSTSFLRRRIQDTFRRFLPKNESVLLFGIVFGGSGGFDKSLQTAFRNSGVLHVVAASGMNVSLVAAFLLSFFERVMKKRKALMCTILGVFYYALLSGFSPSIVRASLMASIAFSAAIFGKQSYGLAALICTAFIMLIVSPGTLFDVGFLLSFSATVGILFIKPIFDGIKLVQKTKFVSDDIGTTVSAQIGSLPVMVGVFGTYPWISVLANALVLWTIPPLMILGGLAAFLALLLPITSAPVLFVCYPLLVYFEKVIVLFGQVPLLTTGTISPAFIIGYYLLACGVLLKLRRRKK